MTDNLLHFPVTTPMGCKNCLNGEFYVGKHNISGLQIVFCKECLLVNGQLVHLNDKLNGLDGRKND